VTHTSSQLNAAIDPDLDNEQSTAIIEAILAGKYSWACVLLLRSAGRNPLHYIPYRTYNRLLKEEMQKRSTLRNPTANSHTTQTKPRIKDLAYLDQSPDSLANVKGGTLGSECRTLLPRSVKRTEALPIWQPALSGFRYML
jgi:hypothetical protein